MGKVNPYDDKKEQVAVDLDYKTVCLGRGGIMFKLFDLGKLAITDKERALVYRNNVGDLVRKFLKSVNGSTNVIIHIDMLESNLRKLGKMAMGDADKYKIYEEEVNKILVDLRG